MARLAGTDFVIPRRQPMTHASRGETRLVLHDVKNVAAGLTLIGEEVARADYARTEQLGRRIGRMSAKIEFLCADGVNANGGQARSLCNDGLAGILSDVADIVSATATEDT